ncbi:Fe-Mn family superoxide dismutase [Streptomyces anandii]
MEILLMLPTRCWSSTEHAYHLQYKNVRPSSVTKLDLVHWEDGTAR